MPTPDMSDEELDRLFQGGAEAYPDEVSLSGWLRLQEQLDAADHHRLVQQQVRQRVTRWFAAELALVGLLTLLWHTKPTWQPGRSVTPPTDTTVAAPGQRQARQLPEQVTSSPRNTGLNRLPLAVRPPADTRPAGLPASAGTLRAAAPAGAYAPHASRPLEGVAGGPGALATRSQRVAVVTSTARPEPGQPNGGAVSFGIRGAASSSDMPPAGSLASATRTVAAEAAAGRAAALGASVPTEVLSADSAALAASHPAALPATELEADSTRPTSRPVAPIYRLLVGVVGGPEATAVLSGPAPRVGGIVGVALEYRLTPRLRARTGLVRSIKRYAAKGADYNPPPTYWTHRIPVDQVDANCRILEIPLDVRYDVAVRPNHTFYASAGLTSLLMRHERYRYLYELNGKYIDKTWSIDRSGNSAFSLVQLSVGMERAVGSRWTMQAEPFVKVPLGGVGFGQIRLSSTGVLLGIKYGLFQPRTATP